MEEWIKKSDAIEAIKDNSFALGDDYMEINGYGAIDDIRALPSADRPRGGWIPCNERLPSEEERKKWIDNNLDGIGNLYPCLVTRYSSINPDRTKNNPYVAKHYFDGEDFVNCGEEVCSEYILAWMPLPEPWKGADDETTND